MVDMNVVYNDIAYKLESNAPTTHNVHISPSPIESLVAIKDELLRQLNEHVSGKHNP